MQVRRILLIQLRQLGDILLTTPCIREIRKESPDAHITFLTHKMGNLILANNPLIDEIVSYHESDSLLSNLKRLNKIAGSRFDLVIDFMNNPRSALFSAASRAPERISFRSSRRLAYNRLIQRPLKSDYIVRDKFLLLKACGFEPEDVSLMFPWFSGDLGPYSTFAPIFAGYPADALRVVLSPTHRRAIRKWPVELYAKLADTLSTKFGAVVTWIWGPGEEAEIDHAISLCRVRTHKAPATTLPELAAFCAQQDVFIGNSNGPSHIAIASGICSLQLHGHTELQAWCPLTSRHRGIQSPEFGENNQATLNSISPDMVLQLFERMLPEAEKQRDKRLSRCRPVRDWTEVTSLCESRSKT